MPAVGPHNPVRRERRSGGGGARLRQHECDPKQEYFSDGLTENISTPWRRSAICGSIARTSTFRTRVRRWTCARSARAGRASLVEGACGARRRPCGSLRSSSDRHGVACLSKTYDRELTAKNVFAIQDEIATGVVNTLAGAYGVLRREGLAAAKRKPPSELSSYDCVLLGMEYRRVISLQSYRLARDCLEKAIKVDPDYAAVWSHLSVVYNQEYTFGYDPHPGSMDRALEAAQRAVRLAPDEA